MRHRSRSSYDNESTADCLAGAFAYQARRDGLLEGLDEVAQTLQRDAEIRAFQAADRAERPWIHFAKKTAGYVA